MKDHTEMKLMEKTEVYKDRDGWWVPWEPHPCGPYATKAEAEADLRGMLRFEKYGDRPGFVTCEDSMK
jgi:hypothetical protein